MMGRRKLRDRSLTTRLSCESKLPLAFEHLESRRLLTVGPELIADLNTNADTTYQLIEFKEEFYFRKHDVRYGVELWKTDGTPSGTTLVKDINPGAASSELGSLFPVGETLFFVADDGTHGFELWKTDGTSEGTVLVKDLEPGKDGMLVDRGNSNLPEIEMIEFEGQLVFVGAGDGVAARGDLFGSRLWISDGTEVGSKILANVFASELTTSGSYVYFAGRDDAHGAELWMTDGTIDGTGLVLDIFPGPSSSNSRRLTSYKDSIVFWASDGQGGSGVWQSDGTVEGTGQIQQVSGNSSEFIEADNLLFFLGVDEHGFETWVTDATAAGTQLLKDVNPTGHSISLLNGVALGAQFLWAADDGTHGNELWISDGTEAGTRLLADICVDGDSDPREFTVIGETAFFTADNCEDGREVWATDGTPEGTRLVQDIESGPVSSNPSDLISVNETLFFTTITTNGLAVWTSDGTESGTVLFINDSEGIHRVSDLTAFENALFFIAAGGQGPELWMSDPATNDAWIVAENIGLSGAIERFYNAGSEAISLGPNVIYSFDDGIHGAEIWRSDGTRHGTQLLKDIYSGRLGSRALFPRQPEFVLFKGEAYFVSNDEPNRWRIWKTDGTTAGTTPVSETTFGRTETQLQIMTQTSDFLFFDVADQLWRTDGTSEGTVMIRDLEFSPFPSAAVAVGETVFFMAGPYGSGELWKTDGTPSGTERIKQFEGNPGDPMPVKGGIVFLAETPEGESQLWNSDGTEEGTATLGVQVQTAGHRTPLLDNAAVVQGDHILFNGNDGVHGFEPWISDGTVAGTHMLLDIDPGESSSFPLPFINIEDMVYFRAGNWLWVTDGTQQGTRRVSRNVRNPGSFSEVDGILYFYGSEAFGAYHGSELWKSDGTELGTQRLTDIATGGLHSRPRDIVTAGQNVLFTADDYRRGRELWRIPANIADVEIPSGAATIEISREGDRLVVLADGVTLQALTFSELGALQLSGAVGEVRLVVDQLDGTAIPPSGIQFESTDAAHLQLELMAGNAENVAYAFSSGQLAVEVDSRKIVLSTLGTIAIEDHLNVEERTFRFTSSDDRYALAGAPNDTMRRIVSDDLMTTVDFDPDSIVLIDGAEGSDQFSIRPDYEFSGDVRVFRDVNGFDGDNVVLPINWSLVGFEFAQGRNFLVARRGDASIHLQTTYAWQNLINRFDVNNDGTTAPSDALTIINDLNRNGPRKLSSRDLPQFVAMSFYDVNGDGYETALDVLVIFNRFNHQILGEAEVVFASFASPSCGRCVGVADSHSSFVRPRPSAGLDETSSQKDTADREGVPQPRRGPRSSRTSQAAAVARRKNQIRDKLLEELDTVSNLVDSWLVDELALQRTQPHR